jgi:hypothetical protein
MPKAKKPKKSKAEARREKQLQKQAKQKKKSVVLSSSVQVKDRFIRSEIRPSFSKKPRSPNPYQYKNNYFSWCCSLADTDDLWPWGEPRQWSDEEYSGIIEPHLNNYKNHSWAQVEAETYNGRGGRRSFLNKYQSVCSLRNEAQERWSELDLFEFDELFRFRLGSQKRIWGFRVEYHFYMIWYERQHCICPVKGNPCI